MAHDVFISYPSQNRAIADAIRTALEASDIRCWIAPRDIPAGVPYATAVIRALNESRLVVLVYSAHANASVHVLSEVDRAHSKGVAIIPVRVQDAPMSEELEYRLSTTQWFDALTRPFEKHLRGLADAVGLRLDSTERSPAGSVHVVAPTMSRRQGAETAVERPERRRASLAGRPVVSSPKDSIRAPLAPVTEAEVSPRHPTAFLFVVDQSESMLRSMSLVILNCITSRISHFANRREMFSMMRSSRRM